MDYIQMIPDGREITLEGAILEYEENKAWWRKLLRFDMPAIRALKRTDFDNRDAIVKILGRFVESRLDKPLAFSLIYHALVQRLLYLSTDNAHKKLSVSEINEKISEIRPALAKLFKVGLLTLENFDAIKAHPKLENLSDLLVRLSNAKLLTQENFDAIKECDYSVRFSHALSIMEEATLLNNKENFNAIITHHYPEELVEAVNELDNNKLLNQKNFDAIKAHDNPVALANGLGILRSLQLLTIENIEKIRGLNPTGLDLLRNLWNANAPNPDYILTQVNFDRLIEYYNGAEDLELRLLEERFQQANTTHTRSIHQSVSASAKKLMKRYGKNLSGDGLEKIIIEIKHFISNLSSSVENNAAKLCVKRITASDYSFTDPASKLTIKKLLALSHLARSDATTRTATVEDANKQFILGLYEIQRGYNISEQGVDDKQKDAPICPAGAFNKLIEKLAGIHKDVELIYRTKEIAAYKLPSVVRDEVKRYLKEQAHPKTKEDFNSRMTLITQLKEEGPQIIWDNIKLRVANVMWDEFNALYDSSRENEDFKGLISAGVYTELNDLSDIQQQIVSSTGYHEYCSQTLWNSARFFSKERDLSSQRHDSPEAQRNYDQQFGLLPFDPKLNHRK